MSDRIAVIAGGRLQQLGAPREIYERPANRFVAQFIGESSFVPVARDGAGFRCAGAPIVLAEAPRGDGPFALMLRPERVRIVEGEPPAGANLLDAVVDDVIYQGDTLLVQATLGDGNRVLARKAAGTREFARAPVAGDRVRVAVAVEDSVLVPDGDD
jgi:putative spermidine/putrescine transport system ATP-binding protein